MSRYTAPRWATALYDLVAYLTEDFLGGPKVLKMAWVINFHKIITLFLIASMMVYFDNFSTAAWVYLGLHGVYGYCWLVKDFGFRDGSFNTRVTFAGAVMTYLCLVAWYWLLPYLFISRHLEPSGPMLFTAIAIHTWGITWMIAADCQKYFSLKYRKGLITDGVFTYTRNPNFLGEIMIYAAYALLASHWIGYAVLAYAILIFYSRMLVKDASISRYPEWPDYAKQSSRLVPWRLLAWPINHPPAKSASVAP
jgi:protein-S-isoprenylcysteine O-methyltransferase Ste14